MSIREHLSRARPALLVSIFFATLGGLFGCVPNLVQRPTALIAPGPPVFEVDSSTPGDALGALRITNQSQLVGGQAASGRIGDYLLHNDVIKVVIDDIPRRNGQAASGGTVIDADRLPGGNDLLSQVFTYLDDTFPRHIVYSHLYVTHSGADGKMAEIVVTGVDSQNPRYVGVTRYQLEPGASFLRMITSITNNSGEMVRNYEVGDSVQWGIAEHYVPGYGTRVTGTATRSVWTAGVGPLVSYGISKRGRDLFGPHGNGWSDVNSGRVNLGRGRTVSYERYLLIGTGDTASISGPAYAIRRDMVETVSGEAVDATSRESVSEARIEAFDSRGHPMGFALTDYRGRFKMDLPEGLYTLRATHRARGSRQALQVDLSDGPVDNVTLELTPPGRFRFRIEELEVGPIPCKLSFQGIRGTPDPEFGFKSEIPGANNVYFSQSGEGELDIPPGHYRVTVSRGIEYDIRQKEISIASGDEEYWTTYLVRVVDTGGYLAADLHQHSARSNNCWVNMRDMAIANLAEGVEIVTVSDFGYLTDFLPLLQEMGLESRLKVVSGQEILDRRFGSVTAFPMELHPEQENNGALSSVYDSPEALFGALRADGEARIIQVNQPRDELEGYFNLLELDPYLGVPRGDDLQLGFNTIEVFNGKRMKNGTLALRDWFNLLNHGYVFTATGNSDSRTVVTQERGYPRNYLAIYSDHPGRVSDQAVLSAIRDRHDVIVTNGPFIRAAINMNGRIGSLISAQLPDDRDEPNVRLEIEVQAPPWIDVHEVEVVANGKVIKRFTLDSTEDIVRFKDTIELRPTRDTWYVVIARGNRGMEPVVPPYKGSTILPFGFTNPIWVDVDGDERFSAIFPREGSARGYVELPMERADR